MTRMPSARRGLEHEDRCGGTNSPANLCPMGCPYGGDGDSVSAGAGARWALALDKAVARVAVVVDAVLSLQVLDVAQVALRMGTGHSIAERLERVQQRFFETAA